MDSLSKALRLVIYQMIDVCTANGIRLATMSPEASAVHVSRGGGGMGYSVEENLIAIDEQKAATAYGGRAEVFYFRALLHEVGHFLSVKRGDTSERAAWEWVRTYIDSMPPELQSDPDVASYSQIVDTFL